MRNSRMGCLIFGLLALFVIMFFNGGRNGGTIGVPSDVNESSSAGGSSSGGGMGEADGSGLEPLNDGEVAADGSSGGMDGDAADGVSLDLDGDGSENDGSDDGSGMLDGEVDAQVSDVRYSVLEAENYGSSIETLEADGEFVLVSLLMENTGDEPLTYFGANMIDDHGQEYSYVAEALELTADEEACEVVTIEPGEEQICTMVFDVNENANAVGLILTDLNLLGGEEEIVELTGLP